MTLMKCLFICIVLFCGTEIANARGLNEGDLGSAKKSDDFGTCSTQGCLDAAKTILLGLDTKVDPCQNFYNYVCGNFEQNIKLSNSESQADKFSIMLDKIKEQIANLVKKDIDPQESKTSTLIKTYYQSCLNKNLIESQGLKPLQDILSKLGGWPVVLGDSWNGENFTWEQTDKLLHLSGYNPKSIYQLFVMRDLKNPSKNILYLKPVETKIKDLWHDQKLLKAYQDYMVDVAVLLGADRNRAIKELNETYNLEFNLFKASKYLGDLTPEMERNRITIKDLQIFYPNVSWLKYLNDITQPISSFKESDFVYIPNPMYLRDNKPILENASKRTLANYMVWRMIDESVEYLNDEIRSKKLLFDKAITGVSKINSREEECMKKMIETDEGLLPGISAMYIKIYFKNEAKTKVANMVSDLHTYYEEILQKNSWLDLKTKETALKKHNVIKRIIGYPKELSDINFLERYYQSVHLTNNNYFKNTKILKKFAYLTSIRNLEKPAEESNWEDYAIAASVIVHYNRIYNAIVLPASVLQPPFFDESQPNYVNYGIMGFFIGHEFTHAFTFEDVPLDENGSLTKWWSDYDDYKFSQRASCFIDHYDNFTTENDKDDDHESVGVTSLNENLADNEGIKVALNAYRTWRSKNGKEQRLPSLNQTNEQLFWISAASAFCTKRTAENKKLQRFTDEHAGEEIRVNGLVANSADFGQAFNCPINSRMNPQQKCNLF